MFTCALAAAVPGTPPSTPPTAVTTAVAVPATATMPVDPSLAVPRTLERQAVDFVAASDYAHAAAVYEVLQQQNPSNRVYAEAARILRAKADGGVP
jgi:hypothetical protein